MAQQLFYFILFLNNNIIITSNKIMWGITHVILPMGMVIPPSMKAIIGITTSPTFRSNSTPSMVQWRTTTSWGMWYFSLNNSIKAGVLTKRSNLPIVSLWNVEWLAEDTVEVRSAKLTWGGICLSLEGRWTLFLVKVWWMPEYERSEVASSDKKQKSNVLRFL